MEFVERRSGRVGQLLDRIPILGDVLKQRLGLLGFAIVFVFVLTVIFGPLIAPYDYAAQDIPSMLQGPSRAHLLGTDHLGRDLLSRIVYGARIALGVAVPSIGIGLAGGLIVGLIAGYFGGLVDNVIVVCLDSLSSFPSVFLALAVLALLGPSLTNVILIIGVTWIPGYARIARAQVLSAKQNVYVEAERALGATRARIIGIHVLPNILAPLLILAAMDLPFVVTVEAGLSFLGLGVRPPTPSWGVILSEGFDYIRRSPWGISWAGLALILTTLGFTLFGEALRDVLDPRLSGTRG